MIAFWSVPKTLRPCDSISTHSQDGDVSIGDSFAIMSYVCTTRSAPDHWYPRECRRAGGAVFENRAALFLRAGCTSRSCHAPSAHFPPSDSLPAGDPAQRAAVDAVVGWHGSMLRASSMITVFNRVLAFQTGMEPAAEAVVDFHVHRLKQSLKVIDGTFLRAGRDWVAGGADISIADLLLACEIDMLTLLDASKAPPTLGSLLERNPRVAAWMQRVERRCDPHWTEARAMLVRARAAFVAKAKM